MGFKLSKFHWSKIRWYFQRIARNGAHVKQCTSQCDQFWHDDVPDAKHISTITTNIPIRRHLYQLPCPSHSHELSLPTLPKSPAAAWSNYPKSPSLHLSCMLA